MNFVCLLAASTCLAVAAIAQQAPQAESIGFVTTMAGDPTQQHFRTVGSLTSGSGRLTASVAVAGEPVAVELLATLRYVDGSGPFEGFVTLTWPQGDALASRYRGTATRGRDGSTVLAGELDVVDGVGRYLGARGRGTVDGFRSGALGSQVEYTVALSVRRGAAGVAAGQGGASGVGGGSATGPAPDGVPFVAQVDLAGVAAEQHLTTTGPGGRHATGTARLTGVGASTGGQVAVEVLGAIDYRLGSGPFTGFLNLDFGGGDLLLCKYDGRAEALVGGTRVLGRIDVLAGGGVLAAVAGHGRLVGFRAGPVGAPLASTISLVLR